MKLLSALAWVGVGWLGLSLWKKGAGYAHFYDKMNYYIKARIHKINLAGITVKADIEIHNPTEVKISISKPVVRIYSDNVEIGHSNPENVNINILPNGVTMIPTIDIVIPWSTAVSKIIAAAGYSAAELMAGGTFSLGIQVVIKSLFNVDGIRSVTQTNTINL